MGTAAAARLLMQGTFGATLDTLKSTAAMSYSQWFQAQAAITPSQTLPSITTSSSSSSSSSSSGTCAAATEEANNPSWVSAWFTNAVQGQDQLRQRVAFALSEIMVTSGAVEPLFANNLMLAYYYDTLNKDALGNFRTLLNDVTLSPTMGLYLSLMRSSKPTGTVHADQNYAREVMQLFTVGLVMLNQDGTVQEDSNGNPIPTYTPDEIVGMSNALTGWSSAPDGHTGDAAWQYDLNPTCPMVAYEDYHDSTDAKTILGGVTIPAGGTAESDLKTALDTIFNHPNVGPFIGKQLIQKLVESDPSPAYVSRVAAVFNNDGTGTRGNLLAVVQAILTDPEAVTAPASGASNYASYGRLREPLIRLTNLWRAFDAYNGSNNLNDGNGNGNVMIYGPTDFDEFPLNSPTVFNFFQPSYSPPGALLNAGLVAPEFEITNESTEVNTNNLLQWEAYIYYDSTGTEYAGPDYNALGIINSSNVALHPQEWESIAASPANLITSLDNVLMGGETLSATVQQALTNYATQVTNVDSRIIETADLVIESPQYAVQR